ncbi:hypothetical protein JOF53_005399 [Crossiella equi]|uniref:HipA-like kinase domain-containing protein n=1 Tax=Crossiella equi TaxID=130796 RepID=A0ABS5AIW9_9PSEU|nr:HipA family kinase [Crossiella equi]MBP2476527.1 hypothetical protein [Crossiella equi]
MRHVNAIRYVTPLREGGSLPGLMEADDLGTYVVKFRGAGQGRKTLVAEVIVGGLARALGLPVPELVTVTVDGALAPSEPDEEVQDLLKASAGLNLGMDFLPGALDFDPNAFSVDGEFAGRVLWFDALTGNVDRSWRNPNTLYWHGKPHLIDHGATLIFHHNWPGAEAGWTRPYKADDHLFIEFGADVPAADAALAPLVTEALLTDVVAEVPDEWLDGEPGFESPAEVRAAYVHNLRNRLAAREHWLPQLAETAATRGNGRAVPERGRNRPDWLKHLPGDVR